MRLIAGSITKLGSASGGGSQPQPPKLLAAFNGASVSGPPSNYQIGLAFSNDSATWQTLSGAQIGPGSGWEATWVAQPWLMWDGTQFVIYYTGYNGTNLAIGRATASNFYGGSWTKYGSNPVIPHGSLGDPDEVGSGMPVIYYDPNDTPKWRMWYHAFPAGSSPTNPAGLTVCYADSSDGLTWTKHGSVIPVGAGGSFNDVGTDNGPVLKVGSTWYVFMAGYHNPGGGVVSRTGYCTTTNPASAGSYSAATQLANLAGTVALQGKTWQSNQARSILPFNGGYLCWLSIWNPTVASGILESAAQTSSPDPTSWVAPTTQLMFPYESWDSISAENPSVIVSP